jgi:LuxR family maltose regulon positive regulatory protein
MPTALLKSKFYIPQAHLGRVNRPRLIERLNAGLGCKLTLISAPAGFGKTTLLSEWAAACGCRVTWISLDRDDNELGRFLAYLIGALQQIQPEIGSAIQGVLGSSRFGPPRQVVDTLLSELVNEIAEIPTSFVLVLDDYHTIREPGVHAAVTFILENQPGRMHTVIMSRVDPPWPLARMRAHAEVNEVRTKDLRFTQEEAGVFLNQTMKLQLGSDDVAILEERTEGWVAGLQMAALSMQGRGDVQNFITAFAGSHHFISDFLIDEVLNQQPENVRDFLLKTSILENLSCNLCDAVTGRKDGRAMLAQLEQANLFLVPLDDERRWFRYHHLFRDLLHTCLETTYPGEEPALHLRASQWYASAEMYEDAIAHAFSANDLGLAAGLIEQAAAHLDVENKRVAITHWIDALPEELVKARPWLCVYRAWGCHWMGPRADVEKWLGAAEQTLQAAPFLTLNESETKYIQGHIAAIRSHDALVHEDIPGVLKNSQLALAALPEGHYMRCETAVALGGAYWGLGDVAAAERAFSLARANALKCQNASMVVPSSCYVGMMQAKQGRLNEAMTTYQDALHYATGPGGRETAVAGFANIKIGDILRERNNLEAAAQHLPRGVEQCFQLGQADVLADGYVGLARLQIALGELENARQTLLKAVQFTERNKVDPFVQCWLDDCRLRLWLSTGDLNAAIQWARASGLKPDGEISYHYDLHHTNLARVMLAQARQAPGMAGLDEARALLERLQAAAEKTGWIQEEIKILVLQALASHAGGEETEALARLERALTLAEPGGFVRVFIDEGEEMGAMIKDCRARLGKNRPTLATYANRLLEHFQGKQAAPASPTLGDQQAILEEALTDRELEVLRLLATSMTTTEIARKLYVAPSTVRTHIKNIYSKLAVSRRMEAVQRAKELGL